MRFKTEKRTVQERPFADIRDECHLAAMTAPTAPHTTIDTDTAFEAMRNFLEAYWHWGGSSSDDIVSLLGSLNQAARGQNRLIRQCGRPGYKRFKKAHGKLVEHKPVDKPQ